MFTGIIEETGKILNLENRGDGARIKIAANIVTKGTLEGDSIAVNGVCLTALNIKSDGFAADVSNETLNRSTLGNLSVGSKVNLERAVTVSSRLGGHIVQGHVDARGRFLEAEQDGDFWTVRISYPKEIGQYLVYKGSVSVEGISLTIANLTDDSFEIAVIPKTWESTNLSTLKNGDEVNLEADVIAKYVERILLYGRDAAKKEEITVEKLTKLGFHMIIQAETTAQIEDARRLFREYEAWLDVDLCFQSFEDELKKLPGKYAAPTGRLFLAFADEKIAGCVALRKIDDEICEMKRLYLREEFRGAGLGKKLIERLIEEAREIGYKKMRLDTLPGKMPRAVKLYESYGFQKIKPYYDNPHKETIFMELVLT